MLEITSIDKFNSHSHELVVFKKEKARWTLWNYDVIFEGSDLAEVTETAAYLNGPPAV